MGFTLDYHVPEYFISSKRGTINRCIPFFSRWGKLFEQYVSEHRWNNIVEQPFMPLCRVRKNGLYIETYIRTKDGLYLGASLWVGYILLRMERPSRHYLRLLCCSTLPQDNPQHTIGEKEIFRHCINKVWGKDVKLTKKIWRKLSSTSSIKIENMVWGGYIKLLDELDKVVSKYNETGSFV